MCCEETRLLITVLCSVALQKIKTPEERPQQTLSDVQEELLRHIHADTIIVGHSLENDLKALRIIHSNVVDTSVVFKQNKYKRSLKQGKGQGPFTRKSKHGDPNG